MKQDPTSTMSTIMMGKQVATLANARSATASQLTGGRTTSTLELKQLLRALGYFCTQEMASFFLDALFDEGVVRRVNTGQYLMYWNATDAQIPADAQQYVDIYGEDVKDADDDDDDDDDVNQAHAMGVKQLLSNTGVSPAVTPTAGNTKPLVADALNFDTSAVPDDAWYTYVTDSFGTAVASVYDGALSRSKARWCFATDTGQDYDDARCMRMSTFRK